LTIKLKKDRDKKINDAIVEFQNADAVDTMAEIRKTLADTPDRKNRKSRRKIKKVDFEYSANTGCCGSIYQGKRRKNKKCEIF
jgi:hypothetical protein